MIRKIFFIFLTIIQVSFIFPIPVPQELICEQSNYTVIARNSIQDENRQLPAEDSFTIFEPVRDHLRGYWACFVKPNRRAREYIFHDEIRRAFVLKQVSPECLEKNVIRSLVKITKGRTICSIVSTLDESISQYLAMQIYAQYKQEQQLQEDQILEYRSTNKINPLPVDELFRSFTERNHRSWRESFLNRWEKLKRFCNKTHPALGGLLGTLPVIVTYGVCYIYSAHYSHEAKKKKAKMQLLQIQGFIQSLQGKIESANLYVDSTGKTRIATCDALKILNDLDLKAPNEELASEILFFIVNDLLSKITCAGRKLVNDEVPDTSKIFNKKILQEKIDLFFKDVDGNQKRRVS